MWTASRNPLPGIGQSPTRNSTLVVVDSVAADETDSAQPQEETGQLAVQRRQRQPRNLTPDDDLGSLPLTEGSFGVASRLLHLESRTNANEQAYRSLVEEIVRLQGEVRTSVRRGDDLWKDERRERLQVREHLETTADGQATAERRLQRLEEAAEKERRSLRSLGEHGQRLEALVGENRRLVEMRKDQQKAWSRRFQDDLEAVAAGVRQSIDQLEKQISSVVSEVKQIKRAEKDRSADIYQILVEMRKQNGALEVTQRDMTESLSHLSAKVNHIESGLNQTRARLEARWNDLGEVLLEMRKSVMKVNRERRMQEEHFKERVSDLQDRLVECVTRQDTDVHAMQKRFSERDRLHDDLEQRATEQIGSLAEELNKRIASVETKISDETNSAVMAIEASLREELDLREGSNREASLSFQREMEVLNSKVDDQVAAVRNGLKLDRVQVTQSLAQLHEAITLIESQSEASSEKLKRVIQAEIQTRHQDLEQLQSRCSELQEKLNGSLSQVQKSIATMSVKMSDDGDQAHLVVKRQLTDANEQTQRRLGDFDVRISMLSSQVAQLTETNRGHLSQIQRVQKDSNLSGMQTLTLNQEAVQTRMKEMQSQFASLSSQISEINERVQLQRIDFSGRIEAEKQARLKDIQAWRREIGNKVNQDAFERVHGGSGQRLSELESKLAQAVSQLLEFETSLHGLKVDLTGRVTSEGTIRTEVLMDVKQELGRMQSQVTQLEYLIHHRFSPAVSMNLATAMERDVAQRNDEESQDQVQAEETEAPLPQDPENETTEENRSGSGNGGEEEAREDENARPMSNEAEEPLESLPANSQEADDGTSSAQEPVAQELTRALELLGGNTRDGDDVSQPVVESREDSQSVETAEDPPPAIEQATDHREENSVTEE